MPSECGVSDSAGTVVLEDAGGEPLDRLLGVPMEVGRFLHLAAHVAVALGKVRNLSTRSCV